MGFNPIGTFFYEIIASFRFYNSVRRKLNEINADVLIAILDSCSSGAFTRIKGGKRSSSFLLEPEGEKIKGHAILTSSSANEAAQESDAIQGSFFTHFLITGLRGAADIREDGFVSLNEVYQFAYHETLLRTEKTQVGTQHPAYDIQMTGSGDIILTDIRLTKSELVFSRELEGRIYVRDERNNLVAELTKISGKQAALGLPAGEYHVLLKTDSKYGSVHVTLAETKDFTITEASMAYQTTESTVARGEAISPSEIPPIGAVAGSALPSQAKRISTPFHFSVIPAFGAYKLIETNTSANLSINLFGGHIAAVDGFEMGTLFNIVDDEIAGFDIAGLFSLNHGRLTGGQVSGLFNVSKKGMEGLQLSLFTNMAGQQSTGAQISGINVANDIIGTQIGLVNKANNVKGAMIGLVNIAEEVDGAPIGIVNAIKGGESHFMTWYSDTDRLLNLGYSSGTQTFHSLFGISYVVGNNTLNINESLRDIILSEQSMFVASLGVGWKYPLKKSYFFNSDMTAGKIFTSTQVISTDSNDALAVPEPDIILPSGHEYIQKFIFSVGKRLNDKLALSFGLSLNTYYLFSTDISLQEYYAPISYLQENNILTIETDSFLMTTWPGFQFTLYVF
jgi:hypothetical protein